MDEERKTFLSRDEQGTYHWTGTIDDRYNKKTGRIIFGALGGVCVLFAVMTFKINPKMLRAALLACLGVMAVTALVTVPFLRASKGRRQAYEMNEDYVRYVAYGRENACFFYGDIRKVRVYRSRCLLEIRGLVVSAPFFVPQEDFRFVENYIVRRLSDRAEVVYE